MQLKKYQDETLEILKKFFGAAAEEGSETAFKKFQRAEGYSSCYQPLNFSEDVPYICLRLPTGGGKTLIGTHSIPLAAEYIKKKFPFVLWLVPFNEIRRQTLKVLRDPKSFYNEFLYKNFQGNVNIFDIADFRDLRPQDLTQKLNICVASFQSLRTSDKEGRKVYQGDEELESCFATIPRQDYFHIDIHGRHESFINLLAYVRPLIIVDEAHNYSTTLSFDVMEKLRPSAVIELTATPTRNSNVLVRVTAQELSNEEMLKLPIILGENSSSLQTLLDNTVKKRAELEQFALAESEYIRPIAFYQAENINGEFNVDAVKKFLVDEEKISENEIAIATGERNELDGVNLFSRGCQIRHIITVEALKEGWDCSFASVFCSVATTHSATDAEQLLGRVLRMPYAKRRKSPALNQAYAFFRVDSWNDAVKKIKDDLFAMGFDKNEINTALGNQPKLFHIRRTFEITTSTPPKTDSLTTWLRNQITYEKVDEGYRVTFENVTEEDVEELKEEENKIFRRKDDREKLSTAIGQLKTFKRIEKSPAERGVTFSIPQLCLDFGDGARVAKHEDFFPAEDWTLTDTQDYSLVLEKGETQFTEIDLRDNRLTERKLSNDEMSTSFTSEKDFTLYELIGWLQGEFTDKFITPEDFAEFTRRVLEKLIDEKNFSLKELFSIRFSLKKALKEKIEVLKEDAYKKNWQTILLGMALPKVRVEKNIEFSFNPSVYPAKKFYQGSVEFTKHFYPIIGDMNNEEVLCAQCIDSNPNVETWIRNIEHDSARSFWLPTHKGKFYPDFVLKLTDGTFAVVEYKGEQLETTDDSSEKNLLGSLWAEKSGGLCKFLMAVKRDLKGKSIFVQIKDFLS